jgi:signal transduction histidine kinase
MWSRLPRRQVLLFLTVILAPCAVLLFLGVRMVEQERQLEEKRASEQRQRRAEEYSRGLFSRLERIKQDLAMGPAANLDEAVVFVGAVREGRLLLPWDTNPDAQTFHKWITEQVFAGGIWRAEREEIAGRFDSAAEHYRRLIDAARRPAQAGYARLLLARTLQKMGRREDSRLEYERVLDSPRELLDEHGIPLALYAAPPLLEAGARRSEIIDLVCLHAESRVLLPPAALYMLHDLAQKTAARNVMVTLADQVRDREKAEALQRDFSRVAPAPSGREATWISYGEPPWLVSVAPRPDSGEARAIVVRANDMLVRLGSPTAAIQLAEGRTGQPLGESFPGLHVVIPIEAEDGTVSRQTFLALALVVVIALTLFAGHLLWRDVRREVRMAEMRSQFVSGVSHELKTPLTAIRMYTEAMRMNEDLEGQTRREYLDTVLKESERLSRLVSSVLDFAKIEQGRKTYNISPVALSEVVDASVRAVEQTLQESGFQLDLDVDRNLPPVPADRDAIEQAILNLLSNAIKYSGKSRWIALHLSCEDSDAVIRVVDHGVGIPRKEQARIFERFYRVRSPENQQMPGTGLGLTLVQHIVKAHGGSVGVNGKPGEGSTFSIRLPLGEES